MDGEQIYDTCETRTEECTLRTENCERNMSKESRERRIEQGEQSKEIRARRLEQGEQSKESYARLCQPETNQPIRAPQEA